MAVLEKKSNSREEAKIQHEIIYKKTRSLYQYEEYDLTDIDRIVRFYIQKQRDKKIALCNVATIMNNIIDCTE